MSKYNCVIFDCDGVLVDSEAIAIGVLVDMANVLGAAMVFKEALQDLKGKSMNYCMDFIARHLGTALPRTFESDYRKRTFEAFLTKIQPIKGIKQVLQNLELPFAVASSGPETKIRLNLEVTGLLPFFEGRIFSCYALKKWKPEPDVYLWAAKTMGFAPSECIVIEDSVAGVEAARAGGFDVFGYTADDIHNKLKGKATATFNTMDVLLKMIKNENKNN